MNRTSDLRRNGSGSHVSNALPKRRLQYPPMMECMKTNMKHALASSKQHVAHAKAQRHNTRTHAQSVRRYRFVCHQPEQLRGQTRRGSGHTGIDKHGHLTDWPHTNMILDATLLVMTKLLEHFFERNQFVWIVSGPGD